MGYVIIAIAILTFSVIQVFLVGLYTFKKFYGPARQRLRDRQIQARRKRTIKIVK